MEGIPTKRDSFNRLWLANEANLKLAGVKEVRVTGQENIAEIPKGSKVVIITSHMTDLDIPVSIHAVAKDLDVVVMNQSVHHKFFGEQGEMPTNIGLRIAGKKNFLPIDFVRKASGKKDPKPFNTANFEPAREAMEKGNAVMIAAHNPFQKFGQNLDSTRGGYGGVYLAALTGAYILPITVTFDRETGMYDPNLLQTLKNIKKANATAQIGKPFKLEKIEGIENFQKINEKKRAGMKLTKEEYDESFKIIAALRERSQEMMKKFSEQIKTQGRQPTLES